MLMPKRVKYRRQQRGRMKGKATRGNEVNQGAFGLVATEPAWITSNQIEAARIAMTRHIKRGGKVWIKIFPDKPVTETPAETRMGKGKGSPEYWVAVVKPGRVLFELADVNEDVAREAMRLAGHKLPVKTKFVKREGDFTVELGKRRRSLAEQMAAEDAAAAAEAAAGVEGEEGAETAAEAPAAAEKDGDAE